MAWHINALATMQSSANAVVVVESQATYPCKHYKMLHYSELIKQHV